MLANTAPPFANERALSAAGFIEHHGSLPRSVPSTSALTGLNPLDVYPTPASANIWTHQTTNPGGAISTTTIGVDARGRVVLTETQGMNTNHQVIGDTWFSYGDLVVYASLAGTPQSVSEVPPQVTKGCN
jgi:hypothetical protein